MRLGNGFCRDLEGLTQYKRRNPFDEYGNQELITVYLRSDVEKKAIAVWGSLEAIEKEMEKRQNDYDQHRQVVFNLKKSLRAYRKRVEQLENPYSEAKYV